MNDLTFAVILLLLIILLNLIIDNSDVLLTILDKSIIIAYIIYLIKK